MHHASCMQSCTQHSVLLLLLLLLLLRFGSPAGL
jgi:hypothetical protein